MVELLNTMIKNVLENEEFRIINNEENKKLFIIETQNNNFSYLNKNNKKLLKQIENFINLVKNEEIELEVREK